jgi:hypothetical protein
MNEMNFSMTDRRNSIFIKVGAGKFPLIMVAHSSASLEHLYTAWNSKFRWLDTTLGGI